MMKSKKSEASISLLVLVTVLLVGASLYLFVTSSNEIKGKIVDARFLDEVYLIEGKLDFYINEIMESSVEKSKNSQNFREDFIVNFNQELEKYKQKEKSLEEEFSEISKDLESLEVTGENVVLRVDFPIIYESDSLVVAHTYSKTFQEEIS